jgi:hypothetical protein
VITGQDLGAQVLLDLLCDGDVPVRYSRIAASATGQSSAASSELLLYAQRVWQKQKRGLRAGVVTFREVAPEELPALDFMHTMLGCFKAGGGPSEDAGGVGDAMPLPRSGARKSSTRR